MNKMNNKQTQIVASFLQSCSIEELESCLENINEEDREQVVAEFWKQYNETANELISYPPNSQRFKETLMTATAEDIFCALRYLILNKSKNIVKKSELIARARCL